VVFCEWLSSTLFASCVKLCPVDKREYENGWTKFPLVSDVLDDIRFDWTPPCSQPPRALNMRVHGRFKHVSNWRLALPADGSVACGSPRPRGGASGMHIVPNLCACIHWGVPRFQGHNVSAGACGV